MYQATFDFRDLFRGPGNPVDAALSLRVIVHLSDALLRCNIDYLLAHPSGEVPRLYESGVFYKTPVSPCGGDLWQPIPTLYKTGSGDCKDLACALAAERIVFDRIYARPIVRRKWLDNGFALYHVVVMYPDGHIEDPSALLGMPAAMGVDAPANQFSNYPLIAA